MKNNSAQFSIPRLNNVMLNALNNILKNTIYNEKLKMATFTRVDINKSKTLAKIYVDTIKRERIDNLVLLLNKNVATFRYELAKIVSM
jgi:ribosome-binding factor A